MVKRPAAASSGLEHDRLELDGMLGAMRRLRRPKQILAALPGEGRRVPVGRRRGRCARVISHGLRVTRRVRHPVVARSRIHRTEMGPGSGDSGIGATPIRGEPVSWSRGQSMRGRQPRGARCTDRFGRRTMPRDPAAQAPAVLTRVGSRARGPAAAPGLCREGGRSVAAAPRPETAACRGSPPSSFEPVTHRPATLASTRRLRR